MAVKKKIKTEDALRAKEMFLEGYSLSEIGDYFSQYTDHQWKFLKNKENWDLSRQEHLQTLKQELKDKLSQKKEMFASALSGLVDQLHERVSQGLIRIESISDVERLLKAVFLHLNDGTEKSQVSLSTGPDWKLLAHQLLEKEKQDPDLFKKLGVA